ncbi:MAG: pantoate--beta-alanine ligase [Candidatus Latescibacterota bacterium]
MIQVITDKETVRKICESNRLAGNRIGLAPTMGALHEGHLSLVRRAAELSDFVTVSIFVNPTQFGPQEDLAKYPRDLEGDVRLLESAGAQLVFAPEADGMYPGGYATWVTVERLTWGLCGASRPDHFRGVATVVAKLFNIVRPDVAVFGQKDAQQAAVIRRMVRDLDMGIAIEIAPIVREPDGLAMSSRNRYLNPRERAEAAVLFRALSAAEELVRGGLTDAAAVKAKVREIIEQSPVAAIDYVEIADPDDIIPLDAIAGDALLALAVRIGGTRLIDNTILSPAKGISQGRTLGNNERDKCNFF